ncbi:NAD(P)-binding protein [Aulographum hederae CBS 113979]|uniref:NAD(P)-binding protein n=1 Tax=Aulographum hederae CBS 113979 TaxID=1176131 RepID=A0A6G1HEM1_9PEZI|nr:NAD(P)-binding protein [Aulographum hederae CBS 113979]
MSFPVSAKVESNAEPDTSNLQGKTVIVTGGSSGLGAAYCKAFLAAGAFVTNADIQLPAEAEASSNYLYVKCDTTSFDAQLSVFKATLEKAPNKRIDIVVANAGIAVAEDDVWKPQDTDDPVAPNLKVLNINLIAMTYTAHLAIHYFRRFPESSKCFILKSSIAGYSPDIPAPQYVSSKWGARGLFRALRWSGDFRINLIAPWFINTPILGDGQTQYISEVLKKKGLWFAEPDDAARAVLMCACDEKMNGRAFAVLPRGVQEGGVVDLDMDYNTDETVLEQMESLSLECMGLPYPRQQVS